MFRKSILLISFVAVLSAAGTASAQLVAWWRFDDGSGTTALDSSGNGNDGTLSGGATWVDGQLGGAIQFNGTNSYVAAPHIPFNDQSFTITMWINPVLYTAQQVVFGQVQTGSANLSMHFRIGGPGGTAPVPGAVRMGFYSNDLNAPGGLILDNNWYHLTFWYDVAGPTRRIYIDGVQVAEDTGAPYQGTTGETRIGQWNNNQWFQGIIDDVQIYANALTEAQIQVSMRGIEGFPYASRANPEDGAIHEATWVTMSWRAGDFAVSHDVYFGDNFDDVNDGAEVAFQGNRTDAMLIAGFPGYPCPDGLVPGTTYYWRIDEVNDADPNSPWVGAVWSFLVPPVNAYAPSPSDGAQNVDADLILTWRPGLNAKLHNIIIGDNFEDVNAAPADSPVTTTSYAPGALEGDKTYYWRVDELNPPTTVKGDVWSFRTMPDIPVHSDPNLVAWWTFDEGVGELALDWSGNGNHVTLVGSQWVTGVLGDSGLSIGSYGAIQNLSYAASDLTEVSVCAWLRTTSGGAQYIVSFDRDNYYRLEINGSGGGTGQVGWDVMTSSGQVDYGSVRRVDDGVWHHVAGVFDNGFLTIYIDGAAEPSTTGGPTYGSGNTRFGFIGANSEATTFDGGRGGGSPVAGEVDDIRIYHKALTLAEIAQVMRGDTRLAWSPSPANGAMAGINVASTLIWSAGDGASQHDVYFGTDRAAVADADNSDTTGVYRGRQIGTSYIPDGITVNSGPYYWRIDEVANGGMIVEGGVWTFSVADYVLIDDFESYNDIPAGEPGSNLVYVAWVDGFDNPASNGSTMGYVSGASLESSIVHSGAKSVPFQYNNATAGVSEVVRTFTPVQDWTAHGAVALSLWFLGDPANVPGQLYVKVNGVRVNYDGETSDLTRSPWQVWNIDLASIGTNLSRVTGMAIGIQGPGASGTLLLDDIRLYARARQLVTPVQPDPAGLIAYFAFEGNTNDGVGGNHGVPTGSPSYLPGKVGQAINLDGAGAYVDLLKTPSELGIGGNEPRTVTVWVLTRSFNNGGIFTSGNYSDAQNFSLRTMDTDNNWRVQYWGGANDADFICPALDRWVHFTHVHDGERTKVYADGRLVVDVPRTIQTADTVTLRIGEYNGNPFDGLIDEFRLYNRAMTAAEAAGAAGRVLPVDEPF